MMSSMSDRTPKKSDDGVTVTNVDLEEQERIEYSHTSAISTTEVTNGGNEDTCDSECFLLADVILSIIIISRTGR